MTIMAPPPRFIEVPGGPRIALGEYGDPHGFPVFFFHGWPSGRVQGALLDPAARAVGARILAIDRPGVGDSHPQSGRRIIDWPPVVAALAEALNLPRFSVLGVSGGGPYALACAWGLADRLTAATVICGAPPLDGPGSDQGFNIVYRSLLSLYARQPGIVRRFFRLVHPLARSNPPPWLQILLRGTLVGPDKETLRDDGISQLCHEGFRQAWGDYRDGVFEDAILYTRPWGFALNEIRVPVRLWHGTADRNFSHHLAEAMAPQIPGSTLRIVENEGHYSLPIRRAQEILADLLAVNPR